MKLKEYLQITKNNDTSKEFEYTKYFFNKSHILPIKWNFNKQTGYVDSIKLFDNNLTKSQKISINYLISFSLLRYSSNNNSNNNNSNNNNSSNNNSSNNNSSNNNSSNNNSSNNNSSNNNSSNNNSSNNNSGGIYNNNIHLPVKIKCGNKNFVEYGYSSYIHSAAFKLLPKLENTIKVLVMRRLNIYNKIKKTNVKINMKISSNMYNITNLDDGSTEMKKIIGNIKKEKAFLANNQIRICNSANYLIFAKFYFNSSYYWPNKKLDVNKQDLLGNISDTIRFYGWTSTDYKQINEEIDQIINHNKVCEALSRRKTYDVLDIPFPGSTDTSCNAYDRYTGIGAHKDIESVMVKPQASITLLKTKKLTAGGEEGVHGSNAETSINMIPGEIHNLQQESIGGLADTHRIQCEDVTNLMFTLLPRIIRHTSYYNSLLVNVIQQNLQDNNVLYHFLMTLVTFKHVFEEVTHLNDIKNINQNDVTNCSIAMINKNIREQMIKILQEWENRELELFEYYKQSYLTNYQPNCIIEKHDCVTTKVVPAIDRFQIINKYCNNNNIDFQITNLK